MGAFLTTPLLPYRTDPGASFASFTAKQSVDPLPVPVARAGQLYEGQWVNVRAFGNYSSLTGASLTLGLWIGTAALAISASLAETSVFTTGTTPAAWPWELDWAGVVTGQGATGSIVGQGVCRLGTSLTAYSVVPFPITDALRTVTIDTTIDRAIGVSATYGASSASNIVKTNGLNVWIN